MKQRKTRTARLWRGLALAGLGLVVLGAGGWAASGQFERYFLDEIRVRGEAALNLYAETTRGWLSRFRALTPIYARDPGVIAALRRPDDGVQIDLLNQELELWNSASGASDTYVLDAEGTTIAASNWSEPISFVGRNYSYRPYFSEAMQGRLGRFFALGTSSGKRGYYFGYPVRDTGRIIGVVVVKASVGEIESELRLSQHEVFVSDPSGVILFAGNPALRMTMLRPLDEADRRRIEEDRQFDLAQLRPSPIEDRETLLSPLHRFAVLKTPDRSNTGPTRYMHLTRPMLAENWVVHLLIDVAPAQRQGAIALLLSGAVVLVLTLIGALIWLRRRQLLERLSARERTQRLLERKVAERTADLSEANANLMTEIAERRAAEEDLRRTQSELIQAGKLAALGQMSAALSHEYNQPLTAIRTYTDNAIAFIESGATGKATGNLARVLRLTERMAQLSKHLTRFARKPKDVVEPVAIAAVLDETLELLHGRINRAGADVSIEGAAGVWVMGGQIRLQHVLMNLIGNALDAAPSAASPQIRVRVTAAEGEVRISVEDNGPGIADALLPRIFDPFFTTKEVGQGLGLGLSISFNIVTDFEGSIRAENRAGGGARFVVTLRSAQNPRREAAE